MHPPAEGNTREWPDNKSDTPFEALVATQRAERVNIALHHLAIDTREVLVLRFQEDLNLSEIAEVTGAPLSTVKSRLYRGLEALRNLLQEEEA